MSVLRDAGCLEEPDGSQILWSVAEGRRGRRWRALLLRNGRLVHALLLEVGLDGRPARLELVTESGMLTLHPEADQRSIHGNVVGAHGVRPLAFEWSPRHGLEVAGSPIPTLVILHGLSVPGGGGVSEQVVVPVLAIGPDVVPREYQRTITQRGDSWTIEDADGGAIRTIRMSKDGVPIGGEMDRTWPLDDVT